MAARVSVLAPDWLRAMFLGQPMAKRIRAVPSGETPSRRDISADLLTSDLSSEPRRTRTIDLSVPQSLFLARSISAPRGARARLHQLAELDLRQRTPFGPNDTWWQLSAPKTEGDTLRATQWVVKRSDVQDWRRRLAAQGYTLRRLYVDGVRPADPIADFSDSIAPGARRLRWLNAGLAAVAVTALAVGWLYPALRADQQTAGLERDLAELRSEALSLRASVEDLRARDTEEATFLDTVLRRPLLVDTLREVTVALPDTVWLDTLTFRPQRVVLTGEADGSAAEIVLGLGKRPIFGNPRLSGPVSRTPSGDERFEITADLEAAR